MYPIKKDGITFKVRFAKGTAFKSVEDSDLVLLKLAKIDQDIDDILVLQIVDEDWEYYKNSRIRIKCKHRSTKWIPSFVMSKTQFDDESLAF